MTVVCAIARGGVTWLGSDTVCVSTEGRMLDIGSKWTIANGWAFGHVGDQAVGDFIADQARLCDQDMKGARRTLFAAPGPAEFLLRLRELFLAMGLRPSHGSTGNDACPTWDNSGLLARAGWVWDIDAALSFTPTPAGTLYARGNAGGLAMAAGHALLAYKRDLSPEIVIQHALLAAAAGSIYIRGVWQGRLAPPRAGAADAEGSGVQETGRPDTA